MTAGPLARFKVLDLTRVRAGPTAVRYLADWGADCIKVEMPPSAGEMDMGGPRHGPDFQNLHRNKRSITLNLKEPDGKAVFMKLVEQADVVVENYRADVKFRLGIDYESLKKVNPRIVLGSISGFGQDGPYSRRPGYGVVCEAVSGLRHLTGDPDRAPSRVGVSMTDYIAGLHGAYGAVMALMARDRTGRGQCIDATLFESAFNFMEVWIPAYDKLGFVPERTGSRLIGSTPNNLYPTADGTYIHITAMADNLFRRLVEAMGRPELAQDPRFADAIERNEQHEALDAIVSEWTSKLPLEQIEAILHQAQVPATRIFTVADIFNDPHYRARNAIVRAPDPHMGDVAMAGVVPRLSDTPGGVRHPGRDVGQDSREVLRNLLGLDAARIEALAKSGVIATGDAN